MASKKKTSGMTDQEVVQNFMILNTKVDGVGTQMFSTSILLEYIIEKMNSAVASGKVEDLAVDVDEYGEFYERRINEIQEQWKQNVQNQMGTGNLTSAGATEPVLDLGE